MTSNKKDYITIGERVDEPMRIPEYNTIKIFFKDQEIEEGLEPRLLKDGAEPSLF